MTNTTECVNSTPGNIAKKLWTAPILQTIPIRDALGSIVGGACDKHGALSTGVSCN